MSGIVGAGGNVGAVLAGFLFKSNTISYSQAFMYIGVAIACVAALVALVNFETTVVKRDLVSLEDLPSLAEADNR